jgi:hypothetical protein
MSKEPEAVTLEQLQKIIRDEMKKFHEEPATGLLTANPPPPVAKQENKVSHQMRTWEKRCPDCGAENPEFKKPNIFCSKCGVPRGHTDEKLKAGDTLDLPPCWNGDCNSSEVRIENGEEQ